MIQITDHPENNYQPSCIHQFCSDVFILTLPYACCCYCWNKIGQLLALDLSKLRFEPFVRTNRSAFHTFEQLIARRKEEQLEEKSSSAAENIGANSF